MPGRVPSSLGPWYSPPAADLARNASTGRISKPALGSSENCVGTRALMRASRLRKYASRAASDLNSNFVLVRMDLKKSMRTSKKFEFKSEDALLAYFRSLEARINARVPTQFSLLPKAGFEIRPVEAFRAKSAAGGEYQGPSEDGTRPGIFYVNTYDLPSRKQWDAEDLFLHEAIPGHHFQIALQQELQGVPAFRRFGGNTAYAEGWGLYAESLGKDLGVYETPYDYFGYLQNELWRAIRLVTDTGLHSKGWTREQVIKYMLDNSAAGETDATAEAERYIAWPSQATAYKIGELQIQALKNKARAALGDGFDPREFHAEVLKDGPVPLSVLEDKIDRWIATKKG